MSPRIRFYTAVTLTYIVIIAALVMLAGCAGSNAYEPAPRDKTEAEWACSYAFAFVVATLNDRTATDDTEALADIVDEWHRETCS